MSQSARGTKRGLPAVSVANTCQRPGAGPGEARPQLMGAARVSRASQPAPRAHQDTVIGLVGEVTRGRGWVVTPCLTRLPGRDSAAGSPILARGRKGSGTL